LSAVEFLTDGRGDGERDILVDIVETETDDVEEVDRILLEAPLISGSSLCRSRFRPLSCSSLASCSSATPFLEFHTRLASGSRKGCPSIAQTFVQVILRQDYTSIIV
jgi:hypothetical protein